MDRSNNVDFYPPSSDPDAREHLDWLLDTTRPAVRALKTLEAYDVQWFTPLPGECEWEPAPTSGSSPTAADYGECHDGLFIGWDLSLGCRAIASNHGPNLWLWSVIVL